MRGELYHVRNPNHARRMWTLFYLILAIILVGGFLLVAGRIRTYYVPTGAIQLSVPYKKYLVGEPITFTVTNNYNSAIFINNKCPEEPLAVYRLEGSTWTRIHEKTDVANCKDADRQVRVAAGGQQSGSYANWPTLFSQPGKYRIVAYVEYFNVAPYQDFEIIARPAPAPAPKPAAPVIRTRNLPAPLPTRVNNDEGGGADNDAAVSSPALQSKTVSVSAGSISVSYSSSYIYVQSIVPASGCTYEGGQSGPFVEVTFKCSSGETQIQLSLSGGVLRTKIEH